MSAARELPSIAGVFTRAAGSSSPSSWNAEARTVEVTLSTGAAVLRRTWAEGPYVETLEISGDAVDLSRADPTRRPAFIHGGLESEGEAPKVDSRAGWDVLGTEYRVVHHFGAGIHDYRAIYFNPGS